MPPDEIENDPVYRNIRGAVEQVVEQFSYDPQVFEAAREAFESWQKAAEGRQPGQQPVSSRTGESKARVEAAREQVEDAIESRLANEDDAPDVLGRLLRQAWFKVLFITAVKQGIDSDSWHGQVAVMDRLIWSMRPKTDPGERQRLLDDMPGLLQELRDGLNSIMYNPAAMTEFFHELQEAHLRILEQPPEAPLDDGGAGRDPAERLTGSPFGNDNAPPQQARSATSRDNVVTADFGAPASAADGTASAGESGAAAQTSDADIIRELRAMAIGSCFEFLDASGRRTRARLQARADNGQRYIFANRRGEQTAEYGLNELARIVAAGDAAPVDEEALFDRALESVIAQLKEQAS
jgi:hypothetical protein